MDNHIFPKWTNSLKFWAAILGGGAATYAVVFVWYVLAARTLNVGYQPEQPVPYSHALHAGELGIDCRYCHNTVERAAHAAIPPTETCMNCHAYVGTESPRLAPLRAAYESGAPVEWIKVHDLPDYVYFNHSAHVNSGVSCVECHGRVDRMEKVHIVERLSMGWCLDCHRNPEPHLRPPELVTQLDWEHPAGDDPEARAEYGAKLAKAHGVAPRESCSTCHR